MKKVCIFRAFFFLFCLFLSSFSLPLRSLCLVLLLCSLLLHFLLARSLAGAAIYFPILFMLFPFFEDSFIVRSMLTHSRMVRLSYLFEFFYVSISALVSIFFLVPKSTPTTSSMKLVLALAVLVCHAVAMDDSLRQQAQRALQVAFICKCSGKKNRQRFT